MLVTYIEAIRQAMDEELARDGNVLLMGEDVGVLGGAFKASAGLQEKHGADRVVDMPISESLIVGAGVGLAVPRPADRAPAVLEEVRADPGPGGRRGGGAPPGPTRPAAAGTSCQGRGGAAGWAWLGVSGSQPGGRGAV